MNLNEPRIDTLSEIISSHSVKLNSLLDKLDNALTSNMNRLTNTQKIDFYLQLNELKSGKLDVLKRRKEETANGS